MVFFEVVGQLLLFKRIRVIYVGFLVFLILTLVWLSCSMKGQLAKVVGVRPSGTLLFTT